MSSEFVQNHCVTMKFMRNSFGAASTLKVKDQSFQMYRLEALDKAGVANTANIPVSIRILLENLLRFEDDRTVRPAISSMSPNGIRPRRPVRSSSGPRVCCCRISRASPLFAILRRCGTRCARWEPTRHLQIRLFPRTW